MTSQRASPTRRGRKRKGRSQRGNFSGTLSHAGHTGWTRSSRTTDAFRDSDSSARNLPDARLPRRRFRRPNDGFFPDSDFYRPSGPLLENPHGIEANREDNNSYEDGEVRRFGAGESYRPFNRDRSPRAARSPVRGRTPPGGSDSYVPNRTPRRRSRSGDRFKRDRSRDVREDRWRRERSRSRPRSPARRSSPRRSPPRRDERTERGRSPRNDSYARDTRRRSRSPLDRERGLRNRSPLARTPPSGPRGGSFRPRSRSLDRRDDKYIRSSSNNQRNASPPRESANPAPMPSRPASGRSSPRPSSNRDRDDRSRPQSPARSPPAPSTLTALPLREPAGRQEQQNAATPVKSPPRGPAALRPPPTGPSASRGFAVPPASSQGLQQRYPQTPAAATGRSADVGSPNVPPSGPRGYVPPPRGGAFPSRGGRGGWSNMPSRHNAPVSAPVPAASSPAPPTGPSGIPTGPRSASTSAAASPSLSAKPFNPPTGPASQLAGGPRPTLAQNLMSNMPAIVPGGKIDPSLTTLTTGVTKDLEQHHRKLKEEEERLREELKMKQEKLRRSLRTWDKLERESKAFELKSDLSEKSLKNLAGEGLGGAAF